MALVTGYLPTPALSWANQASDPDKDVDDFMLRSPTNDWLAKTNRRHIVYGMIGDIFGCKGTHIVLGVS